MRGRRSWRPDAEPGFVSELHRERLAVVVEALLRAGTRSVVDLGCGSGMLLAALSRHARFSRLSGIDASVDALGRARARLQETGAFESGRIALHHGAFDVPDRRLAGHDAAVMLETIEHVHPRRLSAVETAVFCCCRPRRVIVTTPNKEYNALYGMPDHVLRHPDHYFEWTRSRFRAWARGIAERNGYRVEFREIGEADFDLGAPTQMATWERPE
jgi:3' terminal RNA ribose 2'-O-methyltransferase Hen1